MIAVCITTYNHQSYIAQAIESVQAQVCDEPIRIYIGDDASTDGTSAMCERYAAQDKRIIYVRNKSNCGLVNNTLSLYERIIADGCEFIAMLDGDDYWTEPKKLQLQVDYLRAHPEMGFVHTAAYEWKDGELLAVDSPDKPTGDLSRTYGAHGAWHTNSTVLFRTVLLQKNMLDAIRQQQFLVLDYPLYGVFAQQTQFGYIHQYTATWRRHASVSQPSSISTFLRYQYHYARAWHWLEKQYPNRFQFRWYKVIGWYCWQVFYAVIHFCKVYFAKKCNKICTFAKKVVSL